MCDDNLELRLQLKYRKLRSKNDACRLWGSQARSDYCEVAHISRSSPARCRQKIMPNTATSNNTKKKGEIQHKNEGRLRDIIHAFYVTKPPQYIYLHHPSRKIPSLTYATYSILKQFIFDTVVHLSK